jgi:hypothetical protein
VRVEDERVLFWGADVFLPPGAFRVDAAEDLHQRRRRAKIRVAITVKTPSTTAPRISHGNSVCESEPVKHSKRLCGGVVLL